MYSSILTYNNKIYLKWAALLCALAMASYVFHEPGDPPNGGTLLGYILGTIATLIVLWLTWFGYRKRTYTAVKTTLQGWLSAHVYFGLCLLVLATLHSGAQLGWNIHSLAYLLMCLVILSGAYGVYVYVKYPEYLLRNRLQKTREQYFFALNKINKACLKESEKASSPLRETVKSAIDRTVVGGSGMVLLLARDRSMLELPNLKDRNKGNIALAKNSAQQTMIEFLADSYAKSKGGKETLLIKRLLELFAQRKQILTIITKDLQLQALLQVWLYIHVPLTFGMLAALIAHIVSVFLYW